MQQNMDSNKSLTITSTDLIQVVRSPHEETDWILSDGFTRGKELNPKQRTLFPSLANVSDNYSEFQFKWIELVYRASCPTTTGGQVMMGYQADVENDVPNTANSIFTMRPSALCSSWCQESRLRVPSNILNQPGKIFYLDKHLGGESRLTAAGRFFVALYNVPANTILGTLEVRYSVQLKNFRNVNISNEGRVTISELSQQLTRADGAHVALSKSVVNETQGAVRDTSTLGVMSAEVPFQQTDPLTVDLDKTDYMQLGTTNQFLLTEQIYFNTPQHAQTGTQLFNPLEGGEVVEIDSMRITHSWSDESQDAVLTNEYIINREFLQLNRKILTLRGKDLGINWEKVRSFFVHAITSTIEVAKLIVTYSPYVLAFLAEQQKGKMQTVILELQTQKALRRAITEPKVFAPQEGQTDVPIDAREKTKQASRCCSSVACENGA